MNKSDSKVKRRLQRKVKKLQDTVSILEFKLEMKDKRVSSLERSLEDLEKETWDESKQAVKDLNDNSDMKERLKEFNDGQDEGNLAGEASGDGAAGVDGSSRGNDDNILSGESGIGDQIE